MNNVPWIFKIVTFDSFFGKYVVLNMSSFDDIGFLFLLVIKKGNIILVPVSIYVHVVNNWNTRIKCEIYPVLTIKTREGCHWRHWRCSSVFIVNSWHISYLVLVILLLTLNMQLPAGVNSSDFSFPVPKFSFISMFLKICSILWSILKSIGTDEKIGWKWVKGSCFWCLLNTIIYTGFEEDFGWSEHLRESREGLGSDP